ncbi:YncE family protein [Flavobacterium sp. RHBU_3]|uniref:YncE family protein n=1 Tax=Flavobacterium sp. RHBU_3 TaxID=3391184 RepID=UPI003984A8A8
MTRYKNIALAALSLVSGLSFGQGKQYILALSKGEKKVIVYDYKTLDSVAKIPVGADPHEVVTSPDGSRAYISKPLMNDKGHEIAVLNLKTLQAESIIDTKPFFVPHGLVYLNDQLWFTAQGSKAVGIYDIKANTVTEVFGTGQDFTHLLYVTPNGKRFYTTNVESGTVSIYEYLEIPPYMPPTGVLPPNAKPRHEWRQTLVNVGVGAEGFDVSPDGKELWTARPDGHVVIVDLTTKKITADFETKVLGLHRLKITPDGKTVCIVSVKTGDLLYYDSKTHKLEKQVKIGRGAGIYMDKESDRMFVSCTPDNYVVVIDLKTRKEITHLEMGRPDGITSVIVQ